MKPTAMCALALAICAAAPWADEPGALTLRAAITRALEESPRLEPYRIDGRIAGARIAQAGVRPNPTLGLDIEEIRIGGGPGDRARTVAIGGGGGPAVRWNSERTTGGHSGFSEAEFTLSLSQSIELGGKRVKRIALAEREKALALWDYERARADLAAEVAEAYCTVLAAQARMELSTVLVTLAEDVDRSIRARVDAGNVSPLEANRSAVTLANARIADREIHRQHEIARLRLAGTWGADQADFGAVAGDLGAIAPLASLESLRERLLDNPDIARWSEEMATHEARTALERAQRRPDPEFILGYRNRGTGSRTASSVGLATDGAFEIARTRHDSDSSRDSSFVLGFSIPLPIFNRNQGNIAAAELGIAKAGAEQRNATARAASEIAVAHQAASSALETVTSFKSGVEALAEETLEKTRQGYEQGKFSYLDVLDAQRSLVESRTAVIDALLSYRLATVAIERLTGASPAADDVDDASQ